jgi:hypothetical protein
MSPTLDQVTCASLPTAALGVLADLRRDDQVRVVVLGDRAWVRWPVGDARVLGRLLPVAGVELYALCNGRWHRPGCHLPSFDLPAEAFGAGISLAQALVPAPLKFKEPADAPLRAARLGLVRTDTPRTATALRCPVDVLGRWAERAPAAELASVLGAVAGTVALLLGSRLPALPGAERFWGDRVLAPLGYRPDPELSEPALLKALGAGSGELVVLAPTGYEIVPRHVFRRLSRASIRLDLGAPHA